MILNKSNLLVVEILKHDAQIPVLNNVHVTIGGSTVAVSGKAVLAVSPVNDKVKGQVAPMLLDTGDGESSDAVTLSAGLVRELLRSIPRDTKFGGLLEHCCVTSVPEKSETVKAVISDGKRKKLVYGRSWTRKFVDWKATLKKAVTGKKRRMRVVCNLQRLLVLLQTIDKVASDVSGETPLYLEFTSTGDIVIRCENRKTGQRVLALMGSYRMEDGQWLKRNTWESRLLGIR